jgi:transposase
MVRQSRTRRMSPALAHQKPVPVTKKIAPNSPTCSGLGVYRWVVERTFAWLHGFRRLRVRWERRADIHEALLKLACCLITHRQLSSLC